MPTLFSLVAKNLICRELEAKISASKAKDDQKILFVVSVPQNKELAVKKRNFLSTSSRVIEEMPDVGADLLAAKKLIEELTACKVKTSAAAAESSQSTNATELLLDRLKAFVTSFYEKLKRLKLLNQPKEPGPFYAFLEAMAAYHADRIFEKTATSGGFFSNPNITCINQYHRCIDELVDNTLRNALENLKGQNKEDPGYAARKENLGILNIEFLILKNDAIRRSYMLTVTNALSWIPAVLDDHLTTLALALPSEVSAAVAKHLDEDVVELEEGGLVVADMTEF